eukprot:5742639-Pyramimonas_sp.AAC.1
MLDSNCLNFSSSSGSSKLGQLSQHSRWRCHRVPRERGCSSQCGVGASLGAASNLRWLSRWPCTSRDLA